MDWRMCSFILSAITSVGSLVMFIVIKCNDLKHLQLGVNKLEGKLNDVEKKVIENGERVACLEGKLLARIGKGKVRNRKK